MSQGSSSRRFILGLAAVGGLLYSGACAEVSGPDSTFLIHTPADNVTSATVVTFTTSPSSSGAIDFGWEPFAGATRYDIAFWRVATRDSMRWLMGDVTQTPTFRIAVDQPELRDVPTNTGIIGSPTRRMVAHSARLADIHALMTAAELDPGEHYFLWSVFADTQTRRVRSAELHRMVLRR